MPIHVNLKGVSHPSLYHFGLLCAANNTLRDAGGGRIIYQLNWFWYSFSVTLFLSFTPMRFVDFIIQKTDIFHSFYWWCIFNCEIYPVCVNVKLLGRMNSFFFSLVRDSLSLSIYFCVWLLQCHFIHIVMCGDIIFGRKNGGCYSCKIHTHTLILSMKIELYGRYAWAINWFDFIVKCWIVNQSRKTREKKLAYYAIHLVW